MRLYLSIFIVILFLGCNNEPIETTTKGKLHLFITESIAPPLIDGVNGFLSIYQKNGASITYSIVHSDSAAKRFINDSGKIAFLPRQLSKDEIEQSKKISDKVDELIVAYDAIAVITNANNKTRQLTTTEVKSILEGSITKWESLSNKKSVKGKINIYCQDKSDVVYYLAKRLQLSNGVKVKFTNTTSDLQTIKLVENDPLAVGFVALAWIDSAKANIKILDIGRTKEDSDTTFAPPADALGKYFSPDAAFIHLNYYPFKRAIYMYTYSKVDLALGFGTYMATSDGQKLFLKRGILPGTQKIRLKSM